MKQKSIVFVFLLLAAVSCSKEPMQGDVPITEEEKSSEPLLTKSAGPDVKMQLVDHAFSTMKANQILARRFQGKRIVRTQAVIEKEDTVVFVANFEDGWAIVAGDDRVRNPVLAFAAEGHFDPDHIANPEVAFWFEMAKSSISRLSKVKDYKPARLLPPDMNEPYYWVHFHVGDFETVEADSYVNSLLNTTWGQESPWNARCPSGCLTGCVAVATSQILYYLNRNRNFPIGLYHSISPTFAPYGNGCFRITSMTRSDFHNPTTRWAAMAKNKNQQMTSYVADLMVDVGEHVRMIYSSTFSATSNLSGAFQYYGVACDSTAYNFETVKSSLDADLPVMIGAFKNASGHAWVVDGYKDYRVTTDCVYKWYRMDSDSLDYYVGQYDNYCTEAQKPYVCPDAVDGEWIHDYSSQKNQYLKMNWGWDATPEAVALNEGNYSINGFNWYDGYNGSPKIIYNFRHE